MVLGCPGGYHVIGSVHRGLGHLSRVSGFGGNHSVVADWKCYFDSFIITCQAFSLFCGGYWLSGYVQSFAGYLRLALVLV